MMMYVYIVLVAATGFILYVCMFGASSTGLIGDLHNALTGCVCLRPCFRLCCGPRCAKFFSRIEYICARARPRARSDRPIGALRHTRRDTAPAAQAAGGRTRCCSSSTLR